MIDSMSADNGRHRRKDADTDDEDESDFLAAEAMHTSSARTGLSRI